MHSDTEKHIKHAIAVLSQAIRGDFTDEALPHLAREVKLARKSLERAERNIAAALQGDRGGLPAEIDLGGATYRVVRFDPQPSKERRAMGFLGAAVLENRGSLYVCPVIRGRDGESILKPNSVRRIPR